ncbi:MAG: LacI family DNA-binding transcriptional regulator [Oscillospiraceae bacterium]|nr:LacI family DNA-binding transcriptional regulator [Oscillospiraceae bacterium]
MGNRITLDDIARKVNVSKAVVSRALRDKYGVNPETRSRILIAAVELGYDFKNIGRSAATKTPHKGDRICVVVSRTDYMKDDFYGRIIYGIENVLHENQEEFYLSILENEADQEVAVNLRKIRAKGVIVVGLVNYQNIAAILSSGVPVVLVDTLYTDMRVDRISANNFMGGLEAAEHLIQCGHRQLAFVGDIHFSTNFNDRYRGFCKALEDHRELGITDISVTGAYTDPILLIDLEGLYRLIAGTVEPVGIVCANDNIAFEIYRIAEEMGRSIPQDISVIGFCNTEKCGWASPKLTSVEIPKLELGKQAVWMMMDRIARKDTPAQLRQLDTTLEKRDSVADIPIKDR